MDYTGSPDVEEVISTYSYGEDPAYNDNVTITWDERIPDAGGACECPPGTDSRYDTLILSTDYSGNPGGIQNQYAYILLARCNGAGQVKTAVYRNDGAIGEFKVFHEGTMAILKMGESIRYYENYFVGSPGQFTILPVLSQPEGF